MKITYVTGNPLKIKVAKCFLEPLGIEVNNIKLECPEIQADTCEEVAIFSSKWASNELKQDVLKNDSALIIPSLKNFPGPYTRYIEETIGEEGILKLMDKLEDRYAYWIEVLAYTKYGEVTKTFTSITPGYIATQKKGNRGWTYDYIFIPENETKTFAELSEDEQIQFFNKDAYIELAKYLKTID